LSYIFTPFVLFTCSIQQSYVHNRARLPINNNADLNQVGGSHWSLLVCDGKEFIHFDSREGLNEQPAKHVCALADVRIVCVQTAKLLLSILPPRSPSLFYRRFLHTPQQTNGYDCGLYTIECGRIVIETFAFVGRTFAACGICRQENRLLDHQLRVGLEHLSINRDKFKSLIVALHTESSQ
jgi:hypothetical protein